MKVLNLSLDNSVADKNSALAARVVDYGNLVEKYAVVAPGRKEIAVELSEKVKVYISGGVGKTAQFFNIYRTGKRLLSQEKYDVITVQDQYYLALLGLWLAEKYHVSLEIQVHGFEKCRGLRKLIARYVLPRANVIRCVGQRLKRQLVNNFGVAEEKITVVPIYSAINNKQLAINNKKNGDNFIFLTVGRLVPVKNTALAISAMAEVVKKYLQAELWIVGDGPEDKNLKFKIENLKLVNSIKLLGQKSREELENLYEIADVFLLTSDSEGWGLVAIEAASYGLPIIMTDVGCAGEVFKNNESGVIIPVGDKSALVSAMETMLRDETWRQKIGEGARRAVQALPSKQETLNLYLASWRQAVKI